MASFSPVQQSEEAWSEPPPLSQSQLLLSDHPLHVDHPTSPLLLSPAGHTSAGSLFTHPDAEAGGEEAEDRFAHRLTKPLLLSGIESASTRTCESPLRASWSPGEGGLLAEDTTPGSVSSSDSSLMCQCRAQVMLKKWHGGWVRRTLCVCSRGDVLLFDPHPTEVLASCLQMVSCRSGRMVSFPSPKRERRVREHLNGRDIFEASLKGDKKLEIVISTRGGVTWRVRCCSLESLPLVYQCLTQTTQQPMSSFV
ncbi:unnamed protein product [Vitrella brassicaformis CCMP3155]|uniref:PH domain-containing protein n=1 Tax=Vitrella brassicaformis (strain CCMP3155) TaxID=1169540 RepID=A0A0G4GSM5_VITBC|nr:unnamed protein product [Vitrella brassicaformis CCMP3155]|mmetsp:Transcript_1288/g.2841  ORF Transcript_1288/g.2841 Transcript_1288/m.2841 type:complete len:253 (-) Transcript_1288:1016-1774(-)|eukprot:CEM33692.1 unnamed protein product [Vitrella brassicaformis CCMP3155]